MVRAGGKVEIFLEQREVALLSPSKICDNLNFSTEIQMFANLNGAENRQILILRTL